MTGRAPLQGLRVVDTTVEFGCLASRLLGDLGAFVTKVEQPGGSPTRQVAPVGPDGVSLAFAYRNANKVGRTLRLEDPSDREAFDRLLAESDIWFDSTAPALLDDLGLNPAALNARHPHLVVVTITPFGHTGPYRDYQATELICSALSGMLYKGGVIEERPLVTPGPFCSDVSSITAAFAALTARRQAALTGRGQHIDLSLQEAVAQVTDWGMPNGSSLSMLGFEYPRVRAGSGPVYPIFPCKDGHVRLIILSPPAWVAMRDWLGNPDWLEDPALNGMIGRLMIEDVLATLYRELFADKTKMELAHEAQARGIALTPVLTIDEAMNSEHSLARGSFPTTEVSPGVVARAPVGFFTFDGVRCGIRTPAPDGTGSTPVLNSDTGTTTRSGAPASVLERPLDGIRILDFGIGGVGVEAGRMLADYGADVIKIETRTYPDFIRVLGGSEMSASFSSSNRNKRSFGVNAKTDEGRAVLRKLIETADVLIENGSVGAMDSIGLGYKDLQSINPALVIVSSQLMGSTGPWSKWIGYGPSSRTISGLTWLWNYPGRSEPAGSAAIHPDHMCGRLVATAALAGLFERETTGVGSHAEVTQFEAASAILGEYFLAESLERGSAKPHGNASTRHAPSNAYRCSGDERWCAISVRNDDEWEQLRKVMGDPAWAADPAYATTAGRIARHDDIDRELDAWTSQFTDTEVMHKLQGVGIPAGRLVDSLEQAADPQLVHRGYPQTIDQPGLGSIVLEGPAFHGSVMPDPEVRPAPGLGEHTRELAIELGWSPAAVDDLIARGILDEHPLPETETP